MEGLKKELRILWDLQNASQGQSNQFIVQCLHPDLVSSHPSCVQLPTNNQVTASVPIVTSTNPLSKLSPPTCNPSQFSAPLSPMVGLILEFGGPNLKGFIEKNHYKLDVIDRVHILRDVVNALEFLHDHEIVHGDLKPDNIVSFSFLGEGAIRWKLIDFDQSYDLNSHRSLPLTLMGGRDNIGCTPHYCAPELIGMLSGSVKNENMSPLLVSPDLDIWSLGLVAVYTLRGCSVWSLLYPARGFTPSMVTEWNEASLNRLLSFFGEKEMTFLEDCLKLRCPCHKLRRKTLFTTNTSTIQGNVLRAMTGEMNRKFEELKRFVTELMGQSNEIINSDLNDLLREVVVKLEDR